MDFDFLVSTRQEISSGLRGERREYSVESLDILKQEFVVKKEVAYVKVLKSPSFVLSTPGASPTNDAYYTQISADDIESSLKKADDLAGRWLQVRAFSFNVDELTLWFQNFSLPRLPWGLGGTRTRVTKLNYLLGRIEGLITSPSYAQFNVEPIKARIKSANAEIERVLGIIEGRGDHLGFLYFVVGLFAGVLLIVLGNVIPKAT